MIAAELLKRKGNEVTTIVEDEPLINVAEKMRSANVGAIVVLDRKGELVGIVSERDIVKMIVSYRHLMTTISARHGMAAYPLTAAPDTKLDALMTLMTLHRVRHVPIVDQGNLVGLLSTGDVVASMLEEKRTENAVLQDIARSRLLFSS